ncbi:unnamed protein product [Microthlaspi erraticum]|uniref:Leucine-rich repeat-containing N-terminal plant-type domain-containing protein n=1 Tax=Microthlaspi erraticum TaxID=1685480 RepID=A0A6D2JV69_9BRAS|nr:unnamed protein product [Microthlaspi erraticum]
MEGKVFLCKYLIWVMLLLDQLRGYKSCVEKEREALLELKNYIASITKEYPESALFAWTNDTTSDCCLWEEIKCNRTSGRVTEIAFGTLDLKENSLLNLSLFHPFENIRSLNLSKSRFSYLYPIEERGFHEEENNQFHGFFDDVEGYKSLRRLRNLEILDLSSNKFNNSIFPFLNAATSLTTLFLRDNYMDGPFPAKELRDLKNLELLDLSRNRFNGTIPTQGSWKPKFQLNAIVLQSCNLDKIPQFLLQQKHLRLVDLSDNNITGNFPTWLLENNTELKVLRLQNNTLTSFQLPESTHDLAFLDVSSNEFNHLFPEHIGWILPQLMSMNISSNGFQGNLPSSLKNMTEITYLDLSYNSFQGKIPKGFLKDSVEVLKLSHNKLSGEVILFQEEYYFYSISQLLLDNNQFTGKIGQGFRRLQYLSVLDITNNSLSGVIPVWIGELPMLALLLSNNSLEGEIPSSLFNTSTLNVLDLSANRLSGEIPPHVKSSKPLVLLLQDNDLSGVIPDTLLMNVSVLDLRNNRLSGNIPKFVDTKSISILLLRGNNLSGSIPHQLCGLSNIHLLDLAKNRLSGSIPSCLSNTSLGLGKDDAFYYFDLDFSESSNSFELGYALEQDSTFTKTVGRNFKSLLVLDPFIGSFMEKATRTKIEFATKHRYDAYMGDNLGLLFGMDLSENYLSGEIPFELGELLKLHSLNLSHNRLSGVIPESFSGLKNVESLDLSFNGLQGRIPSRLAEMSNLAIFNVSFNNLSGVIPQGKQFNTFDTQSYLGNPLLCGEPTKISCNDHSFHEQDNDGVEADESTVDMVSFYWSAAAAYVTILVGLFASLSFDSPWSRFWFYMVDVFIHKVRRLLC